MGRIRVRLQGEVCPEIAAEAGTQVDSLQELKLFLRNYGVPGPSRMFSLGFLAVPLSL